MGAKNLVLITAGFPFGTGETFLENEIGYITDSFNEVTIIAQDTQSKTQRNVADKCKLLRYDKQISALQKLLGLFVIFNPLFWQEIRIIQNVYQKKISVGIIKTMLISLYQARKLKKYIQRNIRISEDTVFYSYWCDDAALALALLKQKYPQLKVISRIHRWDIYFEESKINYLPFRHFISSRLTIASISKDGLNYAKNTWKVNVSSFILSRLGIIARFPKIENRNNVFTIVSCSNIIPVKRVDLIANALSTITDSPIQWIHFGDGILMEDLKKQIQSLPSNIEVKLLGRVSNPQIHKAYHELKPHLFINVSSSEGIPVSIMEAMSFGIPVIATDVGGNSEIVNNENGLLLSANPSPAEITNAITHFMKMDEDSYLTYSKNSFLTWQEKYNAEKNYREFANILKEL